MLFVNLCISLIIYFVRGSASKYVCSDVNSNVTTNEIYKDVRSLYYGKIFNLFFDPLQLIRVFYLFEVLLFRNGEKSSIVSTGETINTCLEEIYRFFKYTTCSKLFIAIFQLAQRQGSQIYKLAKLIVCIPLDGRNF